MVCGNSSGIECAITAANEENVRMLFFFVYLAVSLYLVLIYNKEKIEALRTVYVTFLLKAARVFSFIFLYMMPFNLMMLSFDVGYEIYVGYYFLFYVPLFVIAVVLLLLMALDKAFQQIGFEGVMDFYDKVRR